MPVAINSLSQDGLDWKKWSQERERVRDEFDVSYKHNLNQ